MLSTDVELELDRPITMTRRQLLLFTCYSIQEAMRSLFDIPDKSTSVSEAIRLTNNIPERTCQAFLNDVAHYEASGFTLPPTGLDCNYAR